jgi:hypothetical protein
MLRDEDTVVLHTWEEIQADLILNTTLDEKRKSAAIVAALKQAYERGKNDGEAQMLRITQSRMYPPMFPSYLTAVHQERYPRDPSPCDPCGDPAEDAK